MIALIDADSIVYVIGWNYREMGTDDEVRASCDNFLKDILTLTNSTHYIGVFSPPSEDVFRTECYKYAKYKGNRPEKPDFIKLWEPVIKNHFHEKHGFICDDTLEADDIVSAAPYILGSSSTFLPPEADPSYIICSPDKDLNQIPGLHYDYKKEGSVIENITIDEAFWFFWTQMLTGDGTDNVAGVPGLGPVKTKKIIEELKEGSKMEVKRSIKAQYSKYFGEYYGSIIFEETLKTLRLMCPVHSLYPAYEQKIKDYIRTGTKKLTSPNRFFDITS